MPLFSLSVPAHAPVHTALILSKLLSICELSEASKLNVDVVAAALCIPIKILEISQTADEN